MPAKIVRASVGEALHRSLELLFKPFSWQRWAKFVLIAWLAGSLSGGCSLGGSSHSKTAPEPTTTASVAPVKAADPSLGQKVEKQHEKKYWFEHSLLKSAQSGVASLPSWYMNVVIWPIFIFILLLIIAFVMFWIWLCAHFQFVWVHAVRTGETQIRRLFRLYGIPADSLATFSCWATFFTLLYYAVLFAVPGWFLYRTVKEVPGAFQDGLSLLPVFWPWILLVIFSLAVTILFFSIISDFVVPLMASDSLLFKEAFPKWLKLYKSNRAAVWRYFGMKAVVSVLCGALTTASVLLVILAFVLAGALLFGLLYLLFMVFLKLKIVFWILAAVFGLPFLTALLFGISLCALPASVFFRLFSLTFLEKLTPSAAEV